MIRTAVFAFVAGFSALAAILAPGPAAAYDDDRARLELFSEPGFRGERRLIYADVGNFAHEGFNDRARSARAHGGTWELCADRDFGGGCAAVRGDVEDLGRLGLAGRVSSARRVDGGHREHGGGGPLLTLFEHEGLQGRSVRLDGPVASLSRFGFNDTARSLRARGAWLVCEDADFGPPCQVVEDEIFDLRRLGMWARISSARPVDGYGAPYGGGYGDDVEAERPAASGRTSAFYPAPRGRRGYVEACPYGSPADTRCADETADRFCQRQGYREARYFIVDRVRNALEDVLCVR